MSEHVVTFGYGDDIYRRRVILTPGYTTRADIPNILGIAMSIDPGKINILTIDGEWA